MCGWRGGFGGWLRLRKKCPRHCGEKSLLQRRENPPAVPRQGPPLPLTRRENPAAVPVFANDAERSGPLYQRRARSAGAVGTRLRIYRRAGTLTGTEGGLSRQGRHGACTLAVFSRHHFETVVQTVGFLGALLGKWYSPWVFSARRHRAATGARPRFPHGHSSAPAALRALQWVPKPLERSERGVL